MVGNGTMAFRLMKVRTLLLTVPKEKSPPYRATQESTWGQGMQQVGNVGIVGFPRLPRDWLI